ncbi:MAG: hypothetical protein HY909_08120 [Deltaproteobacteria bacterium]|nr:hypothetical protein [Deltaproteobacteria bacterium]
MNSQPPRPAHHWPRPAPPPDQGEAFVHDPRLTRRAHASDELAEALAEEYLAAATSGEEITEDVRDEVTDEERGGPFVIGATRPRDEAREPRKKP